MSPGAILYRILIGPLELFFEIVFVLQHGIAVREVTKDSFNQLLLFLAHTLIPKDQVEYERDNRRNEEDKPRNRPPPILERGHKLVIQIHR